MRRRADARRTGRRVRALTAVSCLAAIGAAVLAATWVATSWESSISAEQVDPDIASVLPETVAPLTPATTDLSTRSTSTETTISEPGSSTTPEVGTSRSTAATTASPITDTLLGDLLPPIDRGAAIPEELAARPSPVSLSNTTFDTTRYPVRAIGLEDDGQLEIPDETEIGWYRYGATAGQPGATVLAAHVSWNGTTGPFFELGRLDPGALISVTLDDGTAREYEVTERAKYDKAELPRSRIWRNTGPESLVLITCGGDFNPEIRRYRHNIVVYAVPVG